MKISSSFANTVEAAGIECHSVLDVKKPECPALPSALSRAGMNGHMVLGADQRCPLADQRRPLADQRRPLADQRRPLADQRRPLADQAFSLPLGAAIYTHRFLRSDPPCAREVDCLEKEISRVLQAFHVPRPSGGYILVGTGGTVTTLANLIHKIGRDETSPERMNGLILAMTDLEDLLKRMRKMARQERVDLLGLDPERANVILAGFFIVMMIMRYFQSSELKVSLSDLIEGILIDFIGAEGDAKAVLSPSPYLKV